MFVSFKVVEMSRQCFKSASNGLSFSFQVPQFGTCMPHQSYPQFLPQPQPTGFSPQQAALQVHGSHYPSQHLQPQVGIIQLTL